MDENDGSYERRDCDLWLDRGDDHSCDLGYLVLKGIARMIGGLKVFGVCVWDMWPLIVPFVAIVALAYFAFG